jgi:hypothetical protein
MRGLRHTAAEGARDTNPLASGVVHVHLVARVAPGASTYGIHRKWGYSITVK